MAAARADNGMDPFTVLGISVRAVRGKEDLYKLRKRCKALIDGYLVKRQGSNARRVKWAFDQIKLKVCKEAKEAQELAAAAAGPAEAMGPCPSPPPEAETPEDRLEAIRNKAAARRERTAAGGDDPETEKRRETIREKLAVKRALKQVPVLKEEEARQKVVSFLASPPAGALSPEKVKLSCITTGARLSLPGRGKECQHLQCFDVEQYLLKKYTHCPVCGIALAAPEIFVDSYVTKILSAVDDKVKEVAFSPDGAYAPFKERPPQPAATKSAPPQKPAAAARPEKRPREEKPQAPEVVVPPAQESKKPTEEAPKAVPAAEAKPPKEEKKEKKEEKRAVKAPKLPLTPEQLKEEAQREEKRKRAKLYHALRADEVVDPAEESNYVVVELPTANMGLVLRPNPSLIGGAFVEALETDGAAAKHGGLKAGDQLVGIGEKLVVGQDIDACIDLIVPDSRGLARLAVFRGSASSLYGKGMPSEWLKGFMARVACGEVDLTLPVPEPEPEVEEAPEPEPDPAQEPALEKKKKKNARLSMSSEESGSSDAEADDFSLQLSEDSDGEASPRRAQAALPERLVARITGAGLAADLDACVEALRQPPADGTVEHLESRLVSKAVIKASIASNLESWGLLDDQEQSSWKAAASKRLVRANGERAERLEAMRLVQAQEQQRSSLAEVAAIAASRQGGGLEDAMEDERLLKLEPDKSIKFDRNRTAQLTLRSHSSSHVAFRVRTSAPKFIFVQPCAGTLTPGQHMNLQVCSSERNLGALGTLKFLVQAVPAPDADILPKEKWALLDNSSIQEWSLVGRL